MLDLGSTLDARFFGLGSMLDARFLMVLEMPAVTLEKVITFSGHPEVWPSGPPPSSEKCQIVFLKNAPTSILSYSGVLGG